jgi:hypothetical protein
LPDHFTIAEKAKFESVLRPMIKEGNLSVEDKVAYLTAIKNK